MAGLREAASSNAASARVEEVLGDADEAASKAELARLQMMRAGAAPKALKEPKKDTPLAPRAGGVPDDLPGANDGGRQDSVKSDALLAHLDEISADPQKTLRGAGSAIEKALSGTPSDKDSAAAADAVDTLCNLYFTLTQKPTPTQEEQNLITVLAACVAQLRAAAEKYRAKPVVGFKLLPDQYNLVDAAFIAELSSIDLTK